MQTTRRSLLTIAAVSTLVATLLGGGTPAVAATPSAVPPTGISYRDVNVHGLKVGDGGWTQDGKSRVGRLPLPSLASGDVLSAEYVTDGGRIAGSVHNSVTGRFGGIFLWASRSSTPIALPRPPGLRYGDPILAGLNDRQVLVLGASDDWVWQSGAYVSVKELTGGTLLRARRLNASGELLGTSADGRTAVWTGTRLVPLSAFGNGCFSCDATVGLADDGTVSGSTYDFATGRYTPLFWSADGSVEALALPPGSTSAVTEDIAVHGYVVGRTIDTQKPFATKAVVWHHGRPTPLGSPVGNSLAAAVNGKGTVLGAQQGGSGTYVGMVWDRHGH